MKKFIFVLGVLVLALIAYARLWGLFVLTLLIIGPYWYMLPAEPRRDTSNIETPPAPVNPITEKEITLHQEAKKQILARIKEQRAQEVPLSEIIRDLEQEAEKLSPKIEKHLARAVQSKAMLTISLSESDFQRFIYEQRDKLLEVMVQRNLIGRDLEKEGHIEEAILLYEMSVQDGFDGTQPYDRLRILYRKQKRYADALRVCEAYLDLPERPHGQNKPHFEEWAQKLRSSGQDSTE